MIFIRHVRSHDMSGGYDDFSDDDEAIREALKLVKSTIRFNLSFGLTKKNEYKPFKLTKTKKIADLEKLMLKYSIVVGEIDVVDVALRGCQCTVKEYMNFWKMLLNPTAKFDQQLKTILGVTQYEVSNNFIMC